MASPKERKVDLMRIGKVERVDLVTETEEGLGLAGCTDTITHSKQTGF